MTKTLLTAIAVGYLGLTGVSHADQVPVNIAYPLDGETYLISPQYPILPASFSVTCDDLEDHDVEWGYGEGGNFETLGSAKFRGQITVQFLQKFDDRVWTVFVSSDCGRNEVTFEVGFK